MKAISLPPHIFIGLILWACVSKSGIHVTLAGMIIAMFFTFCWLAVKTGLASLSDDLNWKQLYGVSLVCGIGFTMSLCISSMAFQSGDMTTMVDGRIGIITG